MWTLAIRTCEPTQAGRQKRCATNGGRQRGQERYSVRRTGLTINVFTGRPAGGITSSCISWRHHVAVELGVAASADGASHASGGAFDASGAEWGVPSGEGSDALITTGEIWRQPRREWTVNTRRCGRRRRRTRAGEGLAAALRPAAAGRHGRPIAK